MPVSFRPSQKSLLFGLDQHLELRSSRKRVAEAQIKSGLDSERAPTSFEHKDLRLAGERH